MMPSDLDDRAPRAQPAQPAASELTLRVMSGAAMAVIAVLLTIYGGVLFALFWLAAGAAIFWEWFNLVASADQRARWLTAGAVYAGAAAFCPIMLRADADYGLVAIFFLFAVVWTTDIAAYFVGRIFGGPKLWPAVSPKKTWSGALGGLAGAIIAAFVVASFAALSHGAAIVLAALLSVASQAGDLFESHIKRRFGVKDASHIIPGHGGVMDRLDGFIFAAALATLIGLARGGWSGPGRGLLEW
jgi:phosphatidate cytidylyltransferase